MSTVFARPTWQTGIHIKSVNPGSISGRIVPDIAANADWNASPYLLVVDSHAEPNVGCPDVQHGGNKTAHVGGYQAAAGFDAASGWGTPNGVKLLSALASPVATTHQATPGTTVPTS